MENVYIVTSGEYSDYRIVAVFSSRYRANKFLSVNKGTKLWSWQKESIETYPLDPEFWVPPDNLKYFEVGMYRDGSIKDVGQRYSNPFNNKYNSEYKITGKYGGEIYLSWCGWTKSKKHAIKCANEVRAQTVANNEWPSH